MAWWDGKDSQDQACQDSEACSKHVNKLDKSGGNLEFVASVIHYGVAVMVIPTMRTMEPIEEEPHCCAALWARCHHIAAAPTDQ